MTSEPDSTPWVSIRRLILMLMTALVGLVVVQSLLSSWNEPQVANQLQLYQTDLLLEGSAWKGEGLPPDQWPQLRQGLLGKDPVAAAQEQYEEVREQAVEGLTQEPSLKAAAAPSDSIADEANAGKPLARRLKNALTQQELLIERLDLRLGLMDAYQGQTKAAIARWRQVRDSETATAPALRTADTLIRLWQDEQVTPEDEAWLQTALNGWFEYRALDRLYAVEGQEDSRAQLQSREQASAQSQLVKLALVGTVPALGAVVGIGLLIWLAAQRVLRGSQSVLSQNAGRGWEVPWTGETIWQVLIAG
ncbi:MAG: CPBP family intramembrane glutamate endopeptidase, partial [Nodosilinea sp.]